MTKKKAKALLITFEGGDKCGKSTQISLLGKRLKKEKIPFKVLREPGFTPLGEKIRNILLHSKDYELSSFVEFQLFTTARRKLVEDVVVPFLKNKKGVLILDRFYDSTYVYQGSAGSLDMKRHAAYEKESRMGLVPDITFLLDLPLKEARKRQTTKKDRMERKSKAYHEKVRKGYLKLARQNKKRFKVLNGAGSISKIHESIWSAVEKSVG